MKKSLVEQLLLYEMELATPVQILDKAVCFHLY